MTNHRASLCMVIHSHQPVGNFERVIEDAYQQSYLPFLNVLARHPGIRLSLHYSGVLWGWIEARHPEFMRQVCDLTERGQVEHVGGGYFEPILAAVPDDWKVRQIRRQSEFLRSRFGAMPRGAWVAERVWEQGLIMPLAEAGVEYTVLDDTHFLATGEAAPDLHQAYLTEESGVPLKLVPSLQALRYTIPFREPEETLAVLRDEESLAHGLFAVGDDCEKFGVWPGTYQHCYTNGWLERFFQALEGARDWLDVTTVSGFLCAHPPERRIYLPTASYAEMMMWALPSAATGELEACVEEAARMPDGAKFRRFLRGGPWRNFLSKYPESNQAQKLMLRLAQRWREQRRVVAGGSAADGLLSQAEDHLLAAQCNDSYWHGIFGGLYAPHLRSAVQQRLIRAEEILDRMENENGAARVEVADFDLDGHDELLIGHVEAAAILRPADGGSISSLRSKRAGVELINSLRRRPEAYHQRLREMAPEEAISSTLPASIHDHVCSKEANLGSLLRYDRYARHAFRAYLFPQQKTWQDFDALRLEECADLAEGRWDVAGVSDDPCTVRLRKEIELSAEGRTVNIEASKSFTIAAAGGQSAGWDLDCELALTPRAATPAAWFVGMEIVLNLLAPDSPDRYYSANGERYPLGLRGEIDGARLAAVDEWQHLEITLDAPGALRWWIAPIETVSQSESGFERVYQGSAILAVWNIILREDEGIVCPIKMRVRTLAHS